MLAITECGNIPDIPKCHNMGDTWLYFNSMYSTDNNGTLSLDYIYKFNTKTHWNTLINHEKVISRTEIPLFE